MGKQKGIERIVSLVLATSMLLSMIGTPAFAVEGSAETSSVSQPQESNSAEESSSSAAESSSSSEESSSSAAESSSSSEESSSSAAESSSSVPEIDGEKPGNAEKCVCTELCTAEKGNTDCPICKDGFDKCVFVEKAPECVCTELCTEKAHNNDCPVCKEGLDKCGYAENAENAKIAVILEKTDALLAWFDARLELASAESPSDIAPADSTLDEGFDVGDGMTIRGKDGYILNDEDKAYFLECYGEIMALMDALMESDFNAFEQVTDNADFRRLHGIAQVVGGYAAVPLIAGETYYADGVPLTVGTGVEYTTVFGGGRSASANVASTQIEVKGGTISESLFGGGNGDNSGNGSVVSGNVLINVEANSIIGSLLVGGGVNSSKIMGNININIHGGTVRNVIAGGSGPTSTVGGKIELSIGGGTIKEYVTCGTGGTSNIIYLSGQSAIGTSSMDASGIKVGEFTAISIVGPLKSSNIKLVAPTGAKQGDVLATAVNDSYFTAENFYGVPCYKDGANLRYGYIPGAGGTTIFANGVPFVIEGTDTSATIYIDTNENGKKDDGELSLKEARVTNAPDNGSDLSAFTLYASCGQRSRNVNPRITMNGGRVKSIYGGGYSTAGGQAANTTGTSYITVNQNATVTGDIHGGGYDAWSSGAKINYTNISVSGTVDGTIYGGGHADYNKHESSTPQVGISGNVSININPTGKVKSIYGGGEISGPSGLSEGAYTNANANVGRVDIFIYGTVTDNVYGGGIVRGYVKGGTANANITAITTYPGSKVNGNVYGGGACSVNSSNAKATVDSVYIYIKGGEVGKNIYGSGDSGSNTFSTTAVKEAQIWITGGKITGTVNSATYPGETTQTDLRISGDLVISGGINNLNKFFGGKVTITGALTSGASIMLAGNFALNTVIATANSGVSAADCAQYFRQAAINNGFVASGQDIKIIELPKPTVNLTSKIVYGNGSALLIAAGATQGNTTIYWDKNRNGTVDAGDLSLKTAGIVDAPEDNTDLSEWNVRGGGNAFTSGDTLINMTGGKLMLISGNGGGTTPLTGNTYVNIKGNAEVQMIYGNSYGSDAYGILRGDTKVTISGNAKVTNSVNAGGNAVKGNTNVTVSENATVATIWGAANIATNVAGEVDVTGNAAITVSGGTVNGIVATKAVSGDDGIINGSFTVNASGGTIVSISANVAANVKGTKTINISGNPKIGIPYDAAKGILLDSFSYDNRKYSITMSQAVTEGAAINFVGGEETDIVLTWTGDLRFDESIFTASLGRSIGNMGKYLEISGRAPTVDVKSYATCVFGNGSPLLIMAGTPANTTTVVWDKNSNGTYEPAVDTPITGAINLASPPKIYGGTDGSSKFNDLYGGTKVTMIGGTVSNIYGGGLDANVARGNTEVTITGGTVTAHVYGGCDAKVKDASVSNNTKVTVKGGELKNYVAGGGSASDTLKSQVHGNTEVTINGTAKLTGGILMGGGYGLGTANVSVVKNSTVTIGDSAVVSGLVKSVGTSGSNANVSVGGVKTINVSGSPVIGDKATKGIGLSSTTDEKVYITAPLTGAAGDITLTSPGSAAIVATASTADWADAAKFTLPGKTLVKDGADIKILGGNPVYVVLRKDDAAWGDQAITLLLNGSDNKAPVAGTPALPTVWNSATGKYEGAAAVGFYSVFRDGADTHMDLKLDATKNSVTIDYYSVNYDLQGGASIADYPQEVYLKNTVVNVKFTPTPTKAGAIFAGWDTNKTSQLPEYTQNGVNQIGAGDSLTETGDKFKGIYKKAQIYAIWNYDISVGVISDYPVGDDAILTVQVTLAPGTTAGSSYGVEIGGKKYPATGTVQDGKYIVQAYTTKNLANAKQGKEYTSSITAGSQVTIKPYINGTVKDVNAITYTTRAAATVNNLTFKYTPGGALTGTFPYSGTMNENKMVYRPHISAGSITSISANQQMIDVFGPISGNSRPQTSFQGAGWMTVNSTYGTNQNNVQTWVVPTVVTGVSGNQYVVLTYCFRNNTSGAITNYKIGAHSDVMIGTNDNAPIQKEPYGFRMSNGKLTDESALQFAVITNKEAVGGGGIASLVNTCNTMWFGDYGSRAKNVFANTNASSLTGKDSGAAFSWLIPSLAPGEVQKRSVVIGIADLKALEKDVLEPPVGGFEDLGNLNPEPEDPAVPDNAKGEMVESTAIKFDATAKLDVQIAGDDFNKASNTFALSIGGKVYQAAAPGLVTGEGVLPHYIVNANDLKSKTDYTAIPVVNSTPYPEFAFHFTTAAPSGTDKEDTPSASFDAENSKLKPTTPDSLKPGDAYSTDSGSTWVVLKPEDFDASGNATIKGPFDESKDIVIKRPGTPGFSQDSDPSTVDVDKRPTPTVKPGTADGDFSVTQPTTEDGKGTITMDKGNPGDYVYSTDDGATWQPWPGGGKLENIPQGTEVLIKRPAKDNQLESEPIKIVIDTIKHFGNLVTVGNYVGTYDALPHGINITKVGNASDAVVTYYTDNTYTASVADPAITNVADSPKTVYYTVAKTGYETIKGSATITISKALLTVTYPGDSAVYTGTVPTLSALSYSGFVGGQTDNVLAAKPTVTNTNILPGSYMLTPAGGSAANYSFSYVSGRLLISKANLSGDVTAAGTTVTYDGNWHGITVTLAGSAVGGTITYRTTAAGDYNLSTNPTYKDTGTYTVYYKVSKTGYSDVTGSAQVVISKKVLTVDTVAVNSKTYDGNTATTGGSITLGGVVVSENVSASGSVVFSDKNAGDNKKVNVSDIMLGGAGAGNYVLADSNLNNVATTAKITAKEITLSWNGANKTYDGQPLTVSATAGELVSGDVCNVTVAVTGNSGVTAPNAGSYAATASISNSNYKLPSTATQTYTINKAVLTATYEGAAVIYKDNFPAEAKVMTVTGFVNGETATNIGAGYTAPTKLLHTGTSNFDLLDAGFDSNTLTVGNYAITPADGSATNYTFRYQSGTLQVLNRDFDTVLLQDYTGEYDGQPHLPTIVENDSSVGSSLSIKYYSDTAHTTEVTPSYTDVTNGAVTLYYVVSANSFNEKTGSVTINITPKPITPHLTGNGTKMYDGSTAAPTTGIVLGFNGVVSGETAKYTGGALTMDNKNVGAGKPVMAGTITLADNGSFKKSNYRLTSNTASLASAATVNAKPINLTWSGHTGLTYTGSAQNVTATIPTNAVVSGDTCTVTVTGGNAKNYSATAYTATATLSNENYTASNKTQTYTIAKKALAAKFKDETITYGNLPTLTVEVTGFVGRETATTATGYIAPTIATTPIPTAVGTHAMTLTGGSADNYSFTLQTGTLTIDKADMTGDVSATGYTETYDGNAHGITVTAPAGSTITYQVGGAASTNSFTNAGIYVVTYTVTHPSFNTVTGTATVTIDKKALTPALDTATVKGKTYDKTTAVTTTGTPIVLEGVVGSDTVSARGTIAFVTADAGVDKLVNVDRIALDGTDMNNYRLAATELQNVPTGAEIEAKAVVLTWSPDPASFTYDGSEKSVTATVSSVIVGDSCTVVLTGTSATVPGNYTATATGLSNPNYKLPTVNTHNYSIANGTITGVVVTPTVKPYDGLYSDGATVTGTVTGDDVWYSTVGANGPWSKDIPQIGVDDSKTPIWVKVEREHYNPLVTGSVNAIVKPIPKVMIHKPVFDTTNIKQVTVGGIVTEGGSPITSQRFEIRKTGTSDWSALNAGTTTAKDTLYSQVLATLNEDTEYELRLTATDSTNSTVTVTLKFRTQPKTPPTGEIIGSVTGGTGKITVTLEMGNTVVATIKDLNSGDEFKFNKLPDGEYNLVATDSVGKRVTMMATVKNGGTVTLTTMVIGLQQSVVEVKGDAPPVAADGLQELFDTDTYKNHPSAPGIIDGGGTVEIRLTADEAQDQSQKDAIEAVVGNNVVGLFVDLSVDMIITKLGLPSKVENLKTVEGLLTVAIPLPTDAVGKTGYKMYRHHGAVEELTLLKSGETPSEGTFRIDGKYAYVYSSKFSTYAITYAKGGGASGGPGGGSSYRYYDINLKHGKGGGFSIVADKVTVREGETAGFSIIPQKGYAVKDVLVDGNSIGAVTSYVFRNIREDHTLEATFVEKESKPQSSDVGNDTEQPNNGDGDSETGGNENEEEITKPTAPQTPEAENSLDEIKKDILNDLKVKRDEAIANLPDTLTPEQRQEAIDEINRIYDEAVKAIQNAKSAEEISGIFNKAVRDFDDVLKNVGGELPSIAPTGKPKPFILFSAILALLAIVMAVLSFLKRKKDKEDGKSDKFETNKQKLCNSPILTVAMAAVATLIFLLTTGWQGIAMANWWTLVVALPTVASLLIALQNKKQGNDRETSAQ